MATFQEIADGKYVSLTTFKKDGTPVATPLWGARDGDRLLVWTTADSWKVKRIRRNAKVTVAPCSARGKIEGDAVDGIAEVLDAAGTETRRAAPRGDARVPSPKPERATARDAADEL